MRLLAVLGSVLSISLAAACGGEDPPRLRTGELSDPVADCGDPAALPEIAGNEGPFTRCASDADCNTEAQHFCYQQEGKPGFCQVPDADVWCDGEGDVNLQTVPPLDDWGPGVCVYTEWRDWLCCSYPDRYACE